MKLRSHSFVSQHLPDAYIHEDALLFLDEEERASVACGIRVHGQPLSNLSDAHKAHLRMALMSALNNLEPSCHVDFYWTPENDYGEFIQGHRAGLDPEAPAIAKDLLQERTDTFEKVMRINELRYRKLYVFINLEPPPSQLSRLQDVRRRLHAGSDHQLLLSEWRAMRQKVGQVMAIMERPFEACGMNTESLQGETLRHIYRRMFSPKRHLQRIALPAMEKKLSLWNQILVSDVERDGAFLRFDDHDHAFISMANLPPETRTGFLNPLFNLSFPDYAIKITHRTTDKTREIKALQDDYESKATVVAEQERRGRPVDISIRSQAGEIEEEIRTLNQSPQQIFQVQMILHLWHSEKNELLRRIDEAQAQLGYCHGIQGIVEHIAAPEALRAMLPGFTREKRLDRFHPMKSANAADFVPASTDFVGTSMPQLLFPTPEGGLCRAHVFTDSRPYHNVVVGETGGGKTFLLNSIVTQLVSQGLKSLTVISTKDEFEPLVRLYGGLKISFDQDHPFFLNPCAIAGSEPTHDELSSICHILETIFGDLEEESRRKIRQSRILKAAKISFEKHGIGTRLRHFLSAFRTGWEHDRIDALQDLANTLEPYCQGGLYGEYFDSDTRAEMDLSSPFKFFDFSKVQKDANLSAVMMMTLTGAEARRMAKLPKRWRKALILDECWKFVDNGAGSHFIENSLRVYRAYHCAVFLSSQQAADFLLSKIAHVVMGNCHNFFLLRTLDHKAIDQMRREFSLTDELCARFAAMADPSKVGYSQFIYVHRADSKQIAGEAMNRVSREEALLYSTSPTISEVRDHMVRHCENPWKAVCKLAAMSQEEIDTLSHAIHTKPSSIPP